MFPIPRPVLQFTNSTILDRLNLEPRSYLLLTMHRAANTDSREDLAELLKSLEVVDDTKVVLPIHRRTKRALRKYGLLI